MPHLHACLMYSSSIFMLCSFFTNIAWILFKWVQQVVVFTGLPLFPLLTPFLQEQHTVLLLPLLESEKQFHSEDLLLFLYKLLDSDAWGDYCEQVLASSLSLLTQLLLLALSQLIDDHTGAEDFALLSTVSPRYSALSGIIEPHFPVVVPFLSFHFLINNHSVFCLDDYIHEVSLWLYT